MACTRCQQKAATAKARTITVAAGTPDLPLSATDVQVLEADDDVHALTSEDWSTLQHKLLVLVPEAGTPVCSDELGTLNQWVPAFAELDCELIVVCTDPVDVLSRWYAEQPALGSRSYRTFSSYLLPARLGLIDRGRAKRASVFFTSDGEIVKQECFLKVGRSFAELHRQLYAYTQDEYCGAGWTNPADGFLR